MTPDSGPKETLSFQTSDSEIMVALSRQLLCHTASKLRKQNVHSAPVALWASLVAQLVKNLLAVWETWVQPLGWKDPPEKGKATHSSILA